MIRVGQGYDVHPFDPARPLVIGGVTIPDAPGLAGHSDADVLSHAIADALLGAAALGDLGSFFSDEGRWEGASSLLLVKEAARAVGAAGWKVGNVDATVVAEAPKLAPYRDEMIERLSGALGAPPDAVSVKATTTDGLGSIGRKEGIAAYAVVLLSA